MVGTRERARLIGFRAILAAPMLREGRAIGTIHVARRDPGPFTPRQIALLQIFADQAVIAIENVRLFTELQEKNRALTEAHAQVTESLEQQTATSEILRVIARSPTDVQPVFDAIVASAVRLCEARYGAVFSFDGELVRHVAHHNFSEAWLDYLRTEYPMRPTRTRISGRAILSGSVVQIADVALDPDYGSPQAARIVFRSLLAVPIVRGGAPIGAIVIYRPEAGPFPDKQVALLQTFADQAVIAIENVRLFTELEARNRELTESLEQQTATAEILRVISSSPTDVQPVFDSILERAIRLADGLFGAAFSFDGALVHLVAHIGLSEEALALSRRVYPMAPGPGQLTALALLEKRVVHLRDVDTDRDVPEMTRQLARVAGFRSLLAVPMLREGRPVGVLTVARAAGEFSTRHIELVKIFADQAVIAIENVRLFTAAPGTDGRADALGRRADGAGGGGPRAELDARPRGGAADRRQAGEPARGHGRLPRLRVRRAP